MQITMPAIKRLFIHYNHSKMLNIMILIYSFFKLFASIFLTAYLEFFLHLLYIFFFPIEVNLRVVINFETCIDLSIDSFN